MVQCAVHGCTSRSDTIGVSFRMENAVHFHRVPQDPRIRKKWCEALNRKEIRNGTRVCSLHFRKNNYYSTKTGLQKLSRGSVPELKLYSSDDETRSSVQAPEESVGNQNQCQKSSPKDQSVQNKTADNVPRSSNKQPKEENKETEIVSSEDEEMSDADVETQDQNIHHTTNFQQNWEEKSTNTVSESSIKKPRAQKYIAKTPLEKRLLKEVLRLQEKGKEKMKAIHCLLEQNKRLLKRNSFLEEVLKNSKKVSENAKMQQESTFFKSTVVTTNVSESNS